MNIEKGQIIPGIQRLIQVENALKEMPKAQPKDTSQSQTIFWHPPTIKELRKLKRDAGIAYMGDVG